jgi:hypothetical protein
LIGLSTKAKMTVWYTYTYLNQQNKFFSVSKASRKNSNPTTLDWKKVVNIHKYLYQIENYYISYKIIGKLVGYKDLDFVWDLLTSGDIFFLTSGPIS